MFYLLLYVCCFGAGIPQSDFVLSKTGRASFELNCDGTLSFEFQNVYAMNIMLYNACCIASIHPTFNDLRVNSRRYAVKMADLG